MQKPLSYFVIRVNPELQHDLQVRFDDDALPKLSYFLVEREWVTYFWYILDFDKKKEYTH
jgi:hypothetical protein